ncbi:hypothetical protein EW145_g2606 [Phellinidium pouzarii]|uniref:Uncharacterized protein n=1 Tax=Phellinidium pouzarii TaxID=167371 RepID=A0A4S4LAI1_9AGAM|nr:hypothetical protein EW145_g2606 [Phellinidium pouzarii]
MVATRVISLFVLFFNSLEVLCAPRVIPDQPQAEHLLEATEKLKDIARLATNASRYAKKELEKTEDSSQFEAVSVGVPLIGAASVITTIHQIPALLTTMHDADELQSATSVDIHHSVRVAETLNTVMDATSMQSRASRTASKRTSARTSISNNPGRAQQQSDPAPGLLVGLLGSPDWETGLQRQLATHQWRQRRASRLVVENWQFRHTWHSQQSALNPRHDSARLHTDGSMRNRSVAEWRSRTHSRGVVSSHIPHVSSFGELDLSREDRRRPKSFNAIFERMSTSLSGSVLERSPISSFDRQESRSAGGRGSNVFTASINTHSQRPSTISEVDTPASTQSQLGHRTTTLPFRLQVTDIEAPNNSTAPPVLTLLDVPAASQDSGINSVSVSSSYGRLNTSAESSLVSSWGQLPNFPSPPPTPLSPATPHTPTVVSINTVLVDPYVMNPRSAFLGDPGLGLPADKIDSNFSTKYYTGKGPTAHDTVLPFPDFGWPTFSSSLLPDSLELASFPLSTTSTLRPCPTPHLEAIYNNDLEKDSNDRVHTNVDARRMPFRSLSMNILNRRHSRMRTHASFALKSPPKAYLRSQRTLSLSHISSTTNVKNMRNQHKAPSSVHFSLGLSAPVRPSPLRKLTSLSSSTSARSSEIEVESASGDGVTNTESIFGHIGSHSAQNEVNAENSVTVNRSGLLGSNKTALLLESSNLHHKDSRPSLFLDFDSSAEVGDGEFFLSASESADDDKFQDSQANSSGILEMPAAGHYA